MKANAKAKAKKTAVKYAVTYVDTGDSADGRPRLLGIYKTHRRAKSVVDKDIEEYEKNGYEGNYEDMSATSGGADCVWNIEAVEIGEGD